MNEYISKDKALYFMSHNDKVVHYLSRTAENMVDRTTQALCQVIAELPAADVQPVKHGYWEEVTDYGGWGDTHYRCSVCGEEWYLEDGKPKDNNMNFCPRCGARMDGETECQ